MKLTIEINCDNAAFFDDNDNRNDLEIIRILNDVIFKVEHNYRILNEQNPLLDSNENKVGFYQFTEGD